ncbi:MAG: NFACT family protein [Candidatus Micrarchaeota archaeon]
MTNLEYSFLVDELSPKITGKHFNRIKKLNDGIYRMKIANYEILCELGVRIHLTKYIEQTSETDKFTEKVAKELDNAKLLAITQVNHDRIVLFDFDKAQLIFEMFSDGNAILIRDGKTIAAVKYQSWTGREIKSGSQYSPPKNIPTSGLELSDRYVIVSLMKLPLGKDYVIEALSRAKIDEKKQGNQIDSSEKKKLEYELEKIKKETTPLLFVDGSKIIDYGLTPMSKYSTFTIQESQTLSDAADEYYSKAEKLNPKLEKLLSRLEKQQERLMELLQEEKDFKANGDFIYANYAIIENIIQLATVGKFDELNAQIDKKEKSVTVNQLTH